MHGRNFVKTMLELAAKGKRISVVNDQYGKPTYTKDLANGILKFVKNAYKSGIYHLVNENSTTWFDFAKKIFDLKKIHDIDLVSINSNEIERPAKRPEISILQNTKLPHLRPHEEALNDYLKQL
jgi:dTDP-4-dehydrorhamnose reductase